MLPLGLKLFEIQKGFPHQRYSHKKFLIPQPLNLHLHFEPTMQAHPHRQLLKSQ
jgi:hypothetical protein